MTEELMMKLGIWGMIEGMLERMIGFNLAFCPYHSSLEKTSEY